MVLMMKALLLETKSFIETLPNGIRYLAVYKKRGTLQNTKQFIVPSNHFFLLGDAHQNQKREEGVPYIIHPLAVANILTELKLDSATITTGLLHDTIEDTILFSWKQEAFD